MSVESDTNPCIKTPRSTDPGDESGEDEEPILKLSGLMKQYENEQTHTVFRDLDLAVKQGELLCVLGPSGCGKTTLLNLMAGLATPTEGSLTFEGNPVEGPDHRRGVVFQAPHLFPWLTVRKNIQFGPELRNESVNRERIQELIELIGLEEFEDNYPATLSGGMAQRVSLARTLANDPDLLLMDEPFAALDALTRIQLQDELMRIRKNLDLTIVFVTHDIEEAVYLGDRIAVMSDETDGFQGNTSVELPRPRERGSYEFLEKRHEIFQLLVEPRGTDKNEELMTSLNGQDGSK